MTPMPPIRQLTVAALRYLKFPFKVRWRSHIEDFCINIC